ncbi:MAG TPA: response regulator transcription factor [Candidatus Binatia bacterium]|nr:response regulator transcription factor [Candidatus Binatia bacterium]
MEPKIIIVDDHRLFRACLKSMLEKEGFQVAAEADDGRDAARLIAKLRPQAVITDISMPRCNGIEFTKQIHRGFPTVKVLVVSMHNETRFIMDSFAAGASGYLLKDSGFDEISNALKVVLAGQKYIGPDVSEVVVGRAVAQWLSESQCELPKISSREREVLQLVAEGKSTREIAASLYVSIKTVETHRRQIMGRLNLPNIAQLTKFAIREGITSVQ